MSYKIGEIGHVFFFGAQEYDNSLTLKKKKSTVFLQNYSESLGFGKSC